METLAEFRIRTGSFNRTSLPINGDMQTSAGLSKKVDINGKMIKFRGNTVVFDLPPDFKEEAELIRQKLYEICGDFLAEPINKNTFHITLHDLVNGKPSDEVDSAVKQIESDAIKVVDRIKSENFKIRFKTTYLFNMVNTSVVLGFEAADEESHRKLMEYYECFQKIVKLDHPLTPHMTMAYYKPGTINEDQLRNLQNVIDYVSSHKPKTIELTNDMLSYMIFEDMNTYTNPRNNNRQI